MGEPRGFIAVAAAVFLCAACAPAERADPSVSRGGGPPPAGDIQRGVVFGLFARDEPGYAERNLVEIRDLGANAVSIVIPWVTPNVRSTDIAPRGDMTPSDRSLSRAIQEAHRLGMSVFLMPFIYVDVMGEGEWRGTIAPPDWDLWFGAYEAMILRYARLAQEEKVELLSVGSELCSTESRRDGWLRLIRHVREAYQGALTYSANWDHHDPVSFGDALDYAGINAYFGLSEDPDAGVPEMTAAWAGIIQEVEAWRSRTGKPLILTEVGYPSRRGSATDPWNYTSDAPPDAGVQERCYRAFVEAWTGYSALSGVYFYIWWGEGGPGDSGYTPRGKPAGRILAAWYGGGQIGGRP